MGVFPVQNDNFAAGNGDVPAMEIAVRDDRFGINRLFRSKNDLSQRADPFWRHAEAKQKALRLFPVPVNMAQNIAVQRFVSSQTAGNEGQRQLMPARNERGSLHHFIFGQLMLERPQIFENGPIAVRIMVRG